MGKVPIKNPQDEQKTNLPVNAPMPAFMKGHEGRGVEDISSSDVEIPRIKLLQALSPEVVNNDNLRPGNFYHTLLDQQLGKVLPIVPIYVNQRAILWRPRLEGGGGGGILARADDFKTWIPPDATFNDIKLKGGKTVTWRTTPGVAESGLLEWGSSDPSDSASPPAATRMYNIVCGFPTMPHMGVAVVTLQRSSIRVARKFLGKLKITQAPSYGLVFDMASMVDTNANGQNFQNFAFTAAGFLEDEELFKQYEKMYEIFKAEGIKVRDEDKLQEDDAGPTGDANAGGKDGPQY